MYLLRYSVELCLEEETGQRVDFHRCGILRLATSESGSTSSATGAQWRTCSRSRSSLSAPGVPPSCSRCSTSPESSGPPTCRPTCTSTPPALTRAFAAAATARGARILRHAPVTAIERDRNAWLLETPQGLVRAEVVVDAAGQWAPAVGRLAGGELSIVPFQHQ
jgi:dimethylglycine dehydrogenase